MILYDVVLGVELFYGILGSNFFETSSSRLNMGKNILTNLPYNRPLSDQLK